MDVVWRAGNLTFMKALYVSKVWLSNPQNQAESIQQTKSSSNNSKHVPGIARQILVLC